MALDPWILNSCAYADDGSSSTATALGDKNDQYSVNTSTIYHGRLSIEDEGTGGGTFTGEKLVYTNNGGAETDLTASSTHIRLVTSANLTPGDDCPTRIRTGSGAYITDNNWVLGTTGAIPALTYAQEQEAELIFAFEVVYGAVSAADNILVYCTTALNAAPLDLYVDQLIEPPAGSPRRIMVIS